MADKKGQLVEIEALILRAEDYRRMHAALGDARRRYRAVHEAHLERLPVEVQIHLDPVSPLGLADEISYTSSHSRLDSACYQAITDWHESEEIDLTNVINLLQTIPPDRQQAIVESGVLGRRPSREEIDEAESFCALKQWVRAMPPAERRRALGMVRNVPEAGYEISLGNTPDGQRYVRAQSYSSNPKALITG